MGRSTRVVIAVSVASFLGLSLPVLATDAREAIRLCEKNPRCSYNVADNGITLWVDDGAGGKTYVDCPPPGASGTCQVVRKRNGSVTSVLFGAVRPNAVAR